MLPLTEKEKYEQPSLVVAFKSNILCDEIQFKEIYDQYSRKIYSICLRFLKDKSLAEDAVQEVFIKLWNVRDTLDLNKNIKAYLTAITRNCLLNMLRKHKNEILKIAATSTNIQNELDTEYHVDWKMNLNEFEACISRLSPGKKRIFSMKILQGYSNEEVASALNLSINTVKSQYSQAKSYVEKFLKK
jgi:RNA polymerase sigma-70 factor (family 1)